MKIAVLSDIHGNLAALDAVLADAQGRHVDQIVNLGDICSGPLCPVETAERLMALNLPTIRGNHERQLLTLAPDDMGPSDRHTAALLRPVHREWLAGLPDHLWLERDVLMVHGTPGSDITYYLESVTPDGLRPATRAEVHERTGQTRAGLILCGHTHLPRQMEIYLGDGRHCLIVNPGSVGLPAYTDDRPWPHHVETGSPHARYAVVTRQNGEWSTEFITVAYDWASAANIAQANGRPDWASALATGFAPR